MDIDDPYEPLWSRIERGEEPRNKDEEKYHLKLVRVYRGIIKTHYSPIIEEILEEEQITDRVKEKPTFGGEIRYKKTRAKTPNPKTRGSGYRRQIKEDLQGYDD